MLVLWGPDACKDPSPTQALPEGLSPCLQIPVHIDPGGQGHSRARVRCRVTVRGAGETFIRLARLVQRQPMAEALLLETGVVWALFLLICFIRSLTVCIAPVREVSLFRRDHKAGRLT